MLDHSGLIILSTVLSELFVLFAFIISTALVAFAGMAFNMIPPDFKVARICFSIAVFIWLAYLIRLEWIYESTILFFVAWAFLLALWVGAMKWINNKQLKLITQLDEMLWRHSRWEVPNKQAWYDGSFPIMRQLMQLSNEDLQKRYFEAIQQNRDRGIEEGECYFKGDAILCRMEFGRRIDEGLVTFGKKKPTKLSE